MTDVPTHSLDAVRARLVEANAEIGQAWDHCEGRGDDHPVAPHLERAMAACQAALSLLEGDPANLDAWGEPGESKRES